MAELITETERLRLRKWREGDRAEFVRHLNRPEVMRWLGGVQDEEQYSAAFDRLDSYERDYGHTFWIVERKSDGALLGFCGLKRVNSPGGEALHGEFEIGWRLRQDAWGQGFAKEAATATLDLAFGRFDAARVVALTVPGNSDSWGLMLRLGMKRRDDLQFVDERFGPDLNPCIVFTISADEWAAAARSA